MNMVTRSFKKFNKMNLKTLQKILLDKPKAIEDTPFGPEALVYKVLGKMFALVSWGDDPLRINLKCDPDLALALRAEYKSLIPGYHMNKKHWNSVILDGSIPESLLREMIDNSYDLVVKGLKKADREKLSK